MSNQKKVFTDPEERAKIVRACIKVRDASTSDVEWTEILKLAELLKGVE